MTRLTVVALVLSLAGAGITAQRPIRVYLTPAPPPGEFQDADTKRFADSHADVLKHLQHEKSWVVVDTQDGADIVVELMSAKMEDTGQTSTSQTSPHLPSVTTKPVMLNTVRLKLTTGTYEREFVGTGFWSPAALTAVLKIRDWVKTNRQQLLAKNP